MTPIKRNILLNPGPSTTTDTVKYAQVVPDICPREEEFALLMKNIRDDLVKIVHGDPAIYTAVPFCGSGTICMDIALNSLVPPSTGDSSSVTVDPASSASECKKRREIAV